MSNVNPPEPGIGGRTLLILPRGAKGLFVLSTAALRNPELLSLPSGADTDFRLESTI
jgi:hypothetical protein